MRALPAACALALLGCACAYGHGIGAELLPAQDAGGRGVSVEITGAHTGGDYQKEFALRALDAASGEALPSATYQVRATKAGNVLLDGAFESASGRLVIEMEDGPEESVDGGGLFGLLGDRRVRVAGPHFGTGGLYSFEVSLLALGGELREPPFWRGGVSLADVREIEARTGFGEQAVRHTSYYDTVERLGYGGGRITYSMPFDGSPETVEQTPTVHTEVRFSKELGEMMVSEISAIVNGVAMPPGTVQIDDFAEGYRTVHVVLDRGHLEDLRREGALGSGLDFSVGPAGEDLPFSTVTRNGQYRIVAELSPRQAEPGGALDVSYRIEDVFVKDRPVPAAHTVYAESGGARFFEERAVSRGDGGYSAVRMEVPAGAEGVVHVGFAQIGGSAPAEARLPVAVGGQIPAWVRGTVGLWADGHASDAEFAAAMGHLASAGLIEAGQPGQGGAPGWVKGTARLWTGGQISDAEFAAAVGYLARLGVVRTG